MNIKVLGNRVLVEPIVVDQMKGGILIPDAVTKRPTEAIVVALGKGPRGGKPDFDVKVGDKILLGNYGGHEIKRDGRTFRLLEADGIVAVIH